MRQKFRLLCQKASTLVAGEAFRFFYEHDSQVSNFHL